MKSKPPENRRGQFKPGQSGNPGGRPKGFAEFQEACREHTAAAVKVMVANLKHEDHRLRQAAAEALLDRAWGKPTQQVNVDAADSFLALISSLAGRPDDAPPVEGESEHLRSRSPAGHA